MVHKIIVPLLVVALLLVTLVAPASAAQGQSGQALTGGLRVWSTPSASAVVFTPQAVNDPGVLPRAGHALQVSGVRPELAGHQGMNSYWMQTQPLPADRQFHAT